MTNYLNIQPQNIRKVSKFPFDISSSLQFGNHIFPYADILSMHLVLAEGRLPIRLAAFQLQGALVKIYLQDAHKTLVGICNILPQRRLHEIKKDNLTVGQLQTTEILYSFLHSILQTFGGYYTPGRNALILDSECISCCRPTVCTSVEIQNLRQVFTGPLTLRFQNNITSVAVQKADTQEFTFSAYADPISLIQTVQAPVQTVNGVNLAGKHLILRPALYSNLRVDSSLQNQIKLIGVLDA